MKNGQRHSVLAAAMLALGAIGNAAASTTYTYTYDYGLTVGSCSGTASCTLSGSQTGSSVTPNPPEDVNDPNAPANSISATAVGWSNTLGDDATLSNQTLEKGQVKTWTSSNSGATRTGIGVANSDAVALIKPGETLTDVGESPNTNSEHTVDNNDRWDSVVYSFSQALSLTKVQLSWYSSDSDLTVLAYTGADAGTTGFNIDSKLSGLRYDQLTSNGWSFIQNTNYTGSARYNQSITTSVSSSYWLIGAFNSTFGSSIGTDSTVDKVKIAGLAGVVTNQYTPPPTPPNNNAVPEPASLLLLGLGSLALARSRMKKAV